MGGNGKALFIVGVGASAGGLEAVGALLGHVELDSTAFVIIQHLAPTQPSMLTELLARVSTVEVVTAEQGDEVRANRVYVAPPNTVVTISQGALQLETRDAERPHLPIDTFFRSLAEDLGPRAIGVVLSGTGRDGTLGSKTIKAAGGVAFAQDPATAKFDGMPRSVIESGAADFSLSPEAIAEEIFRVANAPTAQAAARLRDFDAHIGELASLVKKEFALDLAHYKPNTTERRILRRMTLHRLERLDEYVALCRRNPRELATLHSDLLINVTSFFRDPQSFDVLLGTVIPRILERKGDAEPLRVWVPGCASGEEAYSIAICLLEKLDELHRTAKIQIFGTDLDAAAIQEARRGRYPSSIVAAVTPERLRKYFVVADEGHYQISRQVRDLVVFSVQNICVDAPFSRLDLVSCRNLLIYLQPNVQQKVLRVLRYSLLPESFMMLGSSESIGESAELFSLLDRTNKIYVAKHVALPPGIVNVGPGSSVVAATREPVLATPRPMVSIAHLADRKILENYSPPGVVINDHLVVLYYRGRVRPFVEQPSGVATHDILRLVRPELYPALKEAIERAFRDNDVVEVEGQLRDEAAGFRPVSIVVQPLVDPETRSRCLLVLFKLGTAPLVEPERVAAPDRPDERSRLLEQELTLTKDYLQTTIEELERSNEDLKAANEELQSSNEELQSTNEELETAKEELQSTNEELITLNEELQRRMLDLGAAHDDLRNVFGADDRAVLLVGLDLRLRLFSPAAEKRFDLVASDAGRTLSQVELFLGGFALERLVTESIHSVTTREAHITGRDGRRYTLRVVPYKTADLAIRGAVLVVFEHASSEA